jgi:hypothetical protein
LRLAVWHLANAVSWEQLARVPHEQAHGTKRPQYSPAELEQAQRLVKQLPSVKQPPTENRTFTARAERENAIPSMASAARRR